MTLTIGGAFCAEGSPEEIASYTTIMLQLMKKLKEIEDEAFVKKESELFEKLGNMTFMEIMKSEQEDDEKD